MKLIGMAALVAILALFATACGGDGKLYEDNGVNIRYKPTPFANGGWYTFEAGDLVQGRIIAYYDGREFFARGQYCYVAHAEVGGRVLGSAGEKNVNPKKPNEHVPACDSPVTGSCDRETNMPHVTRFCQGDSVYGKMYLENGRSFDVPCYYSAAPANGTAYNETDRDTIFVRRGGVGIKPSDIKTGSTEPLPPCEYARS